MWFEALASGLWPYRATVLRWVDGDTVEVTVDHGMKIYSTQRLRLLASTGGIDTCELSSADPSLRAKAIAAHLRMLELAPIGTLVFLATERPLKGDKADGFGRYLAQVCLPTGINLGDLLLQERLAQPYKRG